MQRLRGSALSGNVPDAVRDFDSIGPLPLVHAGAGAGPTPRSASSPRYSKNMRPSTSGKADLGAANQSRASQSKRNSEPARRRPPHQVLIASSTRDDMNEYEMHGASKRKALAALERRHHNSGSSQNVHQVVANQGLRNGLDRVDVKLHYYRDHHQFSDPLVHQIDEHFMCVMPLTHEHIVNVARVRDATARFAMFGSSGSRSRTQSPEEKSSRPNTAATAGAGSASSPERLVISPFDAAEALRRRVQERETRTLRAIANARELVMERRIGHLLALQQRQSRSELAARARPFLTMTVVAECMLAFRGIVAFYRQALSDEREADEASHKRAAKKPWADKAGGVSLLQGGLAVLRKGHVDIVRRLVLKARLDNDTFRRKNSIWQMWAHNARLALFLVRIMRPYRRHHLMEVAKNFLEVSWRGARIRKTIKAYNKQVRFIQTAVRDTNRLMNVIRYKYFMPLAVAIETRILGEMVGVSPAELEREVKSYLDKQQVEYWKAEAQNLIDTRHKMWKQISSGFRRRSHVSKEPPEIRVRRSATKEGRSVTKDATGAMGSSPRRKTRVTTDSFDLRQMLQKSLGDFRSPARSDAHPTSPSAENAPRASGIAKRAGGRRGAAMSMRLREISENQAAPVSPSVPQTSATALALAGLEGYRLTAEERDNVVSSMFRANVDEFWQAYKAYKASTGAFKFQWVAWRARIDQVGSVDQSLWPDPPKMPDYPKCLLKVNEPELRARISQLLRQKRIATS